MSVVGPPPSPSISKHDRKFPPLTPGIKRYYTSVIDQFLMCPAYYQMKIEEKKIFIRTIMAIGTGIHKGAEVDNHTKKEKGTPAPVKEVVDAAVAEYDDALKEGEVLEGKSEIDAGRDQTATGAGSFADVVSPTVKQPSLIEVPILARYSIESYSFELAGIIDLSDGDGSAERIRDLKTGRKRRGADYAHGRGQLSAYGILFQAIRGTYPAGYQIDSLVLSAQGWRYEALPTDRTQEDYDSYRDRLLAVDAAIRAGSFPPCAEGSWFCSPKWCEYWPTCKYVASRRRHFKEVSDE